MTKANQYTLFEDDRFLVVNKPRGLPVHSTVDRSRASLLSSLPKGLILVHRLDVDTTGVLILAKDKTIAAELQKIWPEVKKVYVAVVEGHPDWQTLTVKNYLRDPGRGRVEVVRAGGKTAITDFTVLARRSQDSVIQAQLRTGRRHQIRSHLAGLGHPIVGDTTYGRRNSSLSLQLHCSQIEFQLRGQTYHWSVKCPSDFAHF